MNLYEWEGKNLFAKHGIAIPRGVVVRRGDDVVAAYQSLGVSDAVVKAQVLSGKRGKFGGVQFCNKSSVETTVRDLFETTIRDQYVAAVRIEEKLAIAEEHYLSITYDTSSKQPVLVYSARGGMDIEEVPEGEIEKRLLDVRFDASPHTGFTEAPQGKSIPSFAVPPHPALSSEERGLIVTRLWDCFLKEDCRLVEINPLVKTTDGRWIAADAKVAIDDDAFFRHPEWSELEPRTMLGRLPTEREIAVKKIDEGEAYYRGTAGKYIEMLARPELGSEGGPARRSESEDGDGDIAILFSGGGASIANMDALIAAGLRPANYTEYSGNPPREKVRELAKIVLSKPGLRGLWICGAVANFTDIAETLGGIVDALDEVKPIYPIVVRRAGPRDREGMQLMRECAERNHLNMKLFGKEVGMSETASVLAEMVKRV